MGGKARVGVIGMGLVGPAIASALRAAGYEVTGVHARSEPARERAEVMLPEVPQKEAEDVASGCDLLIIAVPDDQIEGVARMLSKQGAIRPGQVVAHLWGAGGTEVLEPAAKKGAIPIALHPAMTFTGTSLDVQRLQGCPIAYTTNPVAAPLAEAIVRDIGGEPFFVEQDARVLYHTALTHGANHLVTLVNEAVSVLDSIGVEEPSTVLSPLVKTAAERALNEGWAGLTGPAARGNWATVEAHIQALEERSELLSVARSYRSMADSTRNALHLPGRPIVVTTEQELRGALARAGGPVALVMTMGALHAGHVSLVKQVAKPGVTVVGTIFVNPTQFGEGEDFHDYPRSFDQDVQTFEDAGVHVIYAPSEAEVYPDAPRVTVDPGPAGDVLEGALRPGHFAGVAQVVNKMFNLVRPQTAVFGQKDAQQFSIISQMVSDFDQQIQLVEAPIVRDEFGLALSSRNAYLTDRQRGDALALHASLVAGAEVAGANGTPAEVVEATANALRNAEGVEPQYVALAGKSDFEVWDMWAPKDSHLDVTCDSGAKPSGAAYLLVAAQVGPARLIDNMVVEVNAVEQ